MERRLIIERRPGEARAILLEDEFPVELRVERDVDGSLVGALFWARIVRVVPSLPGAFVELGLDRPAFLPGERLPGGGALVEGAALLVQVAKDAREDKAPEVTAAPSLPGRLAVWTPMRPGLSVSRQIAPAERARLSGLLAELMALDEGIVLRSHAVGARREELSADIERLRAGYAALRAAAETAKPPQRLDPAPGPVERILASIDAARLDEIVVDDRAAFAAARAEFGDRLLLEAPGAFARHGLADVFDDALAPSIALPGGGEVVIETGLAGTFVDVNMGRAGSGRGKAADAVRRLNLEAATAIVRALRLRNIAGTIVIDFVTMQSRDHRREVEQALAGAAAGDPIRLEIHGWTRLGHLETTRRRAAASLADVLLAPAGGRQPKTARTVALELLAALAVTPYAAGRIELTLHPTVAAELKGPLAKALETAALGAGRPISLKLDASRALESFDIASA
ncbi:axial filament protein [Aliidongia dinghuensis]|uniref:Axial filament protein n=1 Tax=Aliidongia dinghuensis TaxID=1867774 RepID=A0A8J2Z0V1_9PROT|nr:ribonuclease E/G [Aliidongia dinghuensis]GGF46662.1 axial filament protein [Aliidongia dinghuensis]